MIVYKKIILVVVIFISIFEAYSSIDNYYTFNPNFNIQFFNTTSSDNKVNIYYDFIFKNISGALEENLEDVFFSCGIDLKKRDGTLASDEEKLENRLLNMKKFLSLFAACSFEKEDEDLVFIECGIVKGRIYTPDLLGRAYEIIASRFYEGDIPCKKLSEGTTTSEIKNRIKEIESLLATISKTKTELEKRADIYYKFSKFNKLRGGSDIYHVIRCIFPQTPGLLRYLGISYMHPIINSLVSGDFLETFFLLKYDYAWKYVALKKEELIPQEKEQLGSHVVFSKGFIFSVVKDEFKVPIVNSDGTFSEEKKFLRYYLMIGGNFTKDATYTLMFRKKNSTEWFYLAYNLSNNSQYVFTRSESSGIKIKIFAGTTRLAIITSKADDFDYAKINFSRYYLPDYGAEIVTKIK